MDAGNLARLIDGRAVAERLRAGVARRVEERAAQGLAAPALAMILVGSDPASEIYVRSKVRACTEAGVDSRKYRLPANVTQEELLELIERLNRDPHLHGILLQLPLPPHLHADALIESIHPSKDVDGFHPYNLGRLAARQPLLRPCTPLGCIRLLESYGITVRGRRAVVVGASNIVGRPMALELLLAGATAVVCHRFTSDLEAEVRGADIVVAAAGRPGLVRGEWIKPGAAVLDVGMNRLDNGTLAGDVDFAAALPRAAYITPVPGGVGPMTVACLLENTLAAAEALDSAPGPGAAATAPRGLDH